MEIRLENGEFIIGEYIINGNYADGYWVRDAYGRGEGILLYDNISLENCIVWCLNS